MKNRRYTIKDIAKMAGVSIGTVDRVVHNRGRVSQETRDAIRAIIHETGYTPNIQASRLSQSKIWRVAALIPQEHQDNGFWSSSHQGLDSANREYQPLGLTVQLYEYDRTKPESFRRAADRMFADGLDALILAPVLPDESRSLLQRMNPEIPLILFDTPLPGANPVSFIGQDAFAAGQTAAHLLSLGNNTPGGLACVKIHPEDHHILQRTRGFIDFFPGDPPPRVLTLHGIEPRDVNRCLDELFDSVAAPGGLYVSNALVGLFAREARRRAPKMRIIGHDLTATNTTLLKEGSLDFLLSQHPADQTLEAVRFLWRSFTLGETLPPIFYMPIEVVSRENLPFTGDR
jgi:LacI family transcriptional regulator